MAFRIDCAYEQLTESFDYLKHVCRTTDIHLYERWKAGGFSIDSNVVSMYPNVHEVVLSLLEHCCSYCGGNCPNEPEDSGNLCDGFAGDIDGLYEG